jgi:hypothetical protein
MISMSHYTLQSGVPTVTHSVVCPTCCARKTVATPVHVLALPDLACSDTCASAYLGKVQQLCERQGWPPWRVVLFMHIITNGYTNDALAAIMRDDVERQHA